MVWKVVSVHDVATGPDALARWLNLQTDEGWTLKFVDSGFLYLSGSAGA